jgi:hypothetical protein
MDGETIFVVGTLLPTLTAAQTETAVAANLSERRSACARSARKDAHIQSEQEDYNRRCTCASLSRAVLRSER